MVTDIVISFVVKGLLGLVGIGLLFVGAAAISDGSTVLGPIMVLFGVILLLGLKFRAN